MVESPTVVLGLDGAGFELIEPWLEAGKLPNIKRAVDTGVRGDLQSVLPPVTSPNWKAYATGKNPGKIGIYWWENIDVEGQRVYYPNERKHQNTEFWEYLATSGGAGVVGVPTTYPPKTLDGFVIAGAPDGMNHGYAAPGELEQRLEREFDYRVLKETRLADDVDGAAAEIHDLIDLRFRVAKQLQEEYDVEFLQVTTFYLNSLHHFLWDHEHTLKGWKIIDEHLESFLDDGWNVVLMSDHGSTEIRTVFHINTWLERKGYLKADTGLAEVVHRVGINTDRLFRLAQTLGLERTAKRLAPKWLLKYIPSESGELEREGKEGTMDWDRTDVVASGQGPVYITVDRDSPRYEQLRSELIDELTGLRDPSGNPVASAVHRGEDIYHGPYLDEAPDLVIEQAAGVHIPGNVGRNEVFSHPSDDVWRGENKRSGLFVATGPAFAPGEVADISILDLAPTLLHLHGHQIPDDMDGTVRKEVFATGSDAARRSVEYQSVTEREKEVGRIREVARVLAQGRS
jgi:predicted AlkP superfamily phosphohydrolase/phosphomutase